MMPKCLETIDHILCWPKSSFGFKVKIKGPFFIFTKNFKCITILFHYLLPFFRQIDNSIFPKLFIFFEQKNVSDAFYSIPGNWNIFHSGNFIKTEINGHLKVQCLVNMADESELLSKAVTIFVWSSKKHMVLTYPDGSLCVSCQLISDTFHWVLFSMV